MSISLNTTMQQYAEKYGCSCDSFLLPYKRKYNFGKQLERIEQKKGRWHRDYLGYDYSYKGLVSIAD